jgi:hypothetical protein
MKEHDKKGWSPYVAGGLSGIVSILSVLIAGKYLGASTTFARSAGMIEKLFGADRVTTVQYFVKYVPKIDWQWMFVVGIFLGSLIAATTSGTYQWKAIPDMWEQRFGAGRTKRGLVAFIGGAIGLFGARLAGG